jgi:hypothetical protein
MQPRPLEYETPQQASRRWFGLAAGLLAVHWLLTIGWGLALNDSGSYLYCRLAMPGDRDLLSAPWLFTWVGIVVLFLLGRADRSLFRISRRASAYPAAVFVFTQLFLYWLNRMSTLD